LSPDAPVDDVEIGAPFRLTLGRSCVAKCVILVKPSTQGTALEENDFLEAPDQAVRRAA
jgi:hypothetical protein